MCGRYVITKPVTKTANIVKTNIKVEDSDNYNAHPPQKLPIIKSYSNIAKSKSCTGFFGTDCIFLNKILSGLRSKCA